VTAAGSAPLVLGLAVLAAAFSCASQQLMAPRQRPPARPSDCAVDIFPGAAPAPMVDLVWASARCLETKRSDCLEQLRRQTCAAGGDTVYALSESADQHITYITATLALRSRPVASPSGPSDAAASGGCSPICSPGFDCQAGRCVPLCNPPCDATEVCNKHRTCEPRATSAP